MSGMEMLYARWPLRCVACSSSVIGINTEPCIHNDAPVTDIQGWNNTPSSPNKLPLLTINAVMHTLIWYHSAAGQMINLKPPH